MFSIIITAYNHGKFIEQVKKSLDSQIFRNFEIIVIDNFSTDGSAESWNTFSLKDIKTTIFLNKQNVGICKAFNQGAKMATGKYLIDLAPDDEFREDKLQKNFELLEKTNSELLFSDCELIDTQGKTIGLHSKLYPFDYQGKGNYFTSTLEKHCIASTSMVCSKKLFNALGGYDEQLSYEDFDFISRATHMSAIVYDKQVLVKKHMANNSLSTQFKKRNSHIHYSTLKVCKKLLYLCRTELEKKALKKRIIHERNGQIKLLNLALVIHYQQLIYKI